jgi:colanic acid biosynthesis glycosyl transferase WcaI
MRILICGINYSPELTGIGKYTGELAEWLASKGHEVKVITAPPYYPDWKVLFPYSTWRFAKQCINGVKVWRCPLWVPKKPSGLKRLLHLFSFAMSSAPVMLAQVFWRSDVVLVIEPPLFCGPIALITAKLSGAQSWLHIQDFELDAAFDLGLLKGDITKKLALKAERGLLNQFNVVSTISHKMLERLDAKGINSNKSILFPNWVDLAPLKVDESRIKSKSKDFRAQLKISPDAVVALYSGNMGNKQGLEILSEVARICQEAEAENKIDLITPKVQFVFCGAGVAKDELVRACADLHNVKFLDLQPLEDLSALLRAADIHLLPQRVEVEDLVMPSKLTGMLASARAVVASSRANTELAKVVTECGLLVEPGNTHAFAHAIQSLAANEGMRTKLGAAGKIYAEKYLDKEMILRAFESRLGQSQT